MTKPACAGSAAMFDTSPTTSDVEKSYPSPPDEAFRVEGHFFPTSS
jgi:hypothetical protein